MRLKSFISLILVFLFMGKLFIVDANAVEVIFQGDISFVKPNCSKKHSIKKSSRPFNLHEHIDSEDSSLQLSSFCTTQFKFDVQSWEPLFSEVLNTKEKIFTSNLSYRYLDSKSPPPKRV